MVEKEISWLPKKRYTGARVEGMFLELLPKEKGLHIALIKVEGDTYKVTLFPKELNKLIDLWGKNEKDWGTRIFGFRIIEQAGTGKFFFEFC